MRKLCLYLPLLLSSFCVLGQDTIPVHYDAVFGDAPELENKPVYVVLEGAWLAQSNAIHLDFVQTVLFGGTLNHTANQHLHQKLNQRNQLMGQQEFGFQLKSALDSSSFLPKGLFCVQWKKCSWNHLVFSKDVFGLALLGNAPFLGQKLDLSNTSFTQLSYQKIGLGLESEKGGWSFFINGIEGSDFYQFRIDKGEIYSDPNGSFIDLNYRMVQVKSLQPNSGVGIGLDFQWKKNFGEVQWIGEVADLGWIKFKDVERSAWSADDSFAGISWSEAILNGQEGDEALAQWTEPLKKTKDRSIQLPTRLTAGVSTKGIGYRVITYCFERQLGWQTLYFSKSNLPIKHGILHYELGLNHTFNDRYALSGEVGFMNNKKDFSLSVLASELPGFLMANSRQLMCQISIQKRIF